MSRSSLENPQSGAALIIVLLLVATLSFILLSITTIVSASVGRSAADRARADGFWKADAGVVIATEILAKYLEQNPARMSHDEGVFGEPIEVPIDGGKATLLFRDATRCFNINSLVSGSDGQYAEAPENIERFVRLMESIGLGSGEANKLADVIVDYMDSDANSRPQGAEDGFYTALPTPFRTAGRPLVSVSELQALDGVGRQKYRRIRPFLCADKTTSPMSINGNFLRAEAHAELIAAQLPADPPPDVGALQNAIGAIPPGGAASADKFPEPLNALPGIATVSNRIEAVIRLEVNGLAVEEKLLFDAKAGARPKLLARTFGEDF